MSLCNRWNYFATRFGLCVGSERFNEDSWSRMLSEIEESYWRLNFWRHDWFGWSPSVSFNSSSSWSIPQKGAYETESSCWGKAMNVRLWKTVNKRIYVKVIDVFYMTEAPSKMQEAYWDIVEKICDTVGIEVGHILIRSLFGIKVLVTKHQVIFSCNW